MKKLLSKIVLGLVMFGLTTPAFATGFVQLRSPVRVQRVQQVQKVQVVQQVQKVQVQKQIQLFDTVVVTPHSQFFRVQPSTKVVEVRQIQQVISPQKVLIERQEYAPVVVERVVVPTVEKVIIEQRINSYRDYCR